MISLFNRFSLIFIVALYQFEYGSAATDDDKYKIGVGIADITGPSAEINMVSIEFFSTYSENIFIYDLFEDGLRKVWSGLFWHSFETI
jgi:hypothetical protein